MNFRSFAIFALDELLYAKFDKGLCYEDSYERRVQIATRMSNYQVDRPFANFN